jgi:hypothetical protein
MAGAVTTESYSELQARYEDLLRGEVRATTLDTMHPYSYEQTDY